MFVQKSPNRVAGVIAGGFLLCAATAANASLIGDTITVTNESPLGTILNSQFVVVTEANEAVSLGGAAFADINAASIEIIWTRGVATRNGPFNGYVFSDLDWLPDAGSIVGVSLVTNIDGITMQDVTFTADSVAIDTEGTARTNTSFLNVFLETSHSSQIPEPGTLAMFGLGLAGLGLARRRRAA